ncbi:F-box protein At5g39250-like isoform X2 [Primulina huaijiensis]
MSCDEILKAVFPLLDSTDLVTCMLVCKHWQEIALDDYFWQCLCAKKWPSICKRSSPPSETCYKLFKTFFKRQRGKALLPPRLSFNDLEFYFDLWTEQKLIFSEVVPGTDLQNGTWAPCGICDVLKFPLESPEYKMTLPVHPRFSIPSGKAVTVSVLISRKDCNKVACIMNNSIFEYIDRSAYRAFAFDYLDFSPAHPFVSSVMAWISLLFTNHSDGGLFDVFGIELDFCDVANSKDQVLQLLDILGWK